MNALRPSKTFLLLAPLLLAIIAILAAGCGVDPSQPFTFENATDASVTVRVNDRLRLMLRPGETKAFNTPRNLGNRRVLAVDLEGKVHLDKLFTWAELEAMGFHVVIR